MPRSRLGHLDAAPAPTRTEGTARTHALDRRRTRAVRAFDASGPGHEAARAQGAAVIAAAFSDAAAGDAGAAGSTQAATRRAQPACRVRTVGELALRRSRRRYRRPR